MEKHKAWQKRQPKRRTGSRKNFREQLCKENNYGKEPTSPKKKMSKTHIFLLETSTTSENSLCTIHCQCQMLNRPRDSSFAEQSAAK